MINFDPTKTNTWNNPISGQIADNCYIQTNYQGNYIKSPVIKEFEKRIRDEARKEKEILAEASKLQ